MPPPSAPLVQAARQSPSSAAPPPSRLPATPRTSHPHVRDVRGNNGMYNARRRRSVDVCVRACVRACCHGRDCGSARHDAARRLAHCLGAIFASGYIPALPAKGSIVDWRLQRPAEAGEAALAGVACGCRLGAELGASLRRREGLGWIRWGFEGWSCPMVGSRRLSQLGPMPGAESLSRGHADDGVWSSAGPVAVQRTGGFVVGNNGMRLLMEIKECDMRSAPFDS